VRPRCALSLASRESRRRGTAPSVDRGLTTLRGAARHGRCAKRDELRAENGQDPTTLRVLRNRGHYGGSRSRVCEIGVVTAGRARALASSLAHSQQTGYLWDVNDQLVTLWKFVEDLAREEKYDKAIATITSDLIPLAATTGDPTASSMAFAYLGDVLSRTHDFAKAELAFNEARKLAHNQATHAFVESQSLASRMRRDPQDDRLVDEYEELITAIRSVGDQLMLADAISNLAVLVAQADDDAKAAQLFSEAASIYRRRGSMRKYVDSAAMAGAMMRASGNDEDAVAVLSQCLESARTANDTAAIARIAGDLARTHVCLLLEGGRPDTPEYRQHISDLIAIFDEQEDRLWDSARSQEHDAVGAMISRGQQLHNNIETAILFDSYCECDDLVAARIMRAKGRILSERSSIRAAASNEAPQLPELSAHLAAVTGKEIAVIDYLGLSADKICAVIFTYPSEMIRQSTIWHYKDQPANVSTAGALNGNHQVRSVRTLLEAIIIDFERLMNRVPFLFPSGSASASENLQFVADEYEQIRPSLQAFGDFILPSEVRELLVDAKTRHLILSPDPRLFHFPWNALEFSNGMTLMDYGWTVSVTPSLPLLDALPKGKLAAGMVVASPDPEVTQMSGGLLAVNFLKETFGASTLIDGDATLENWAARVAHSGVAHVVTHGGGNATRLGPTLAFADRHWSEPLSAMHAEPALLVSVACRTGSTVSLAQDAFGLVSLALESGFSTVLAPVVTTDGVICQELLEIFYLALDEGASVSDALNSAIAWGKTHLVHPALWGSLICVGDGSVVLRT